MKVHVAAGFYRHHRRWGGWGGQHWVGLGDIRSECSRWRTVDLQVLGQLTYISASHANLGIRPKIHIF